MEKKVPAKLLHTTENLYRDKTGEAQMQSKLAEIKRLNGIQQNYLLSTIEFTLITVRLIDFTKTMKSTK